MKRITMWYNCSLDLAWTLSVNIAGEALAGYLWWRIAPLSDFELNIIIASVFLAYVGVSLIFIAWKYKNKSERIAKLTIGEQITAVNYNGRVLKDVKECKIENSPLKEMVGICNLRLRARNGREMLIKNVPAEVEEHL